MTIRRAIWAAMFAATAYLLGWVIFVGLPRWYGPPAVSHPAPSVAGARLAQTAERKIKARLFYVGDDGTRLSAVERDVAYAEDTTSQAKEIVQAQLAPVTDPLVSAIPAGTMLRAIFVTPQGQAFVDLSADVTSAHPGGSLGELLTIYTIVDALTFNLPAVSSVQLLVDGKEVTTLAGHVDLRRPLVKNASVVEEPATSTEESTRVSETDTRKSDAIR